MFAKQTLSSASLVVVLLGAAVIARADPAASPETGAIEVGTGKGTGTFEIGAGFSSYEGFIARARVEQSSLFGSGHMLALDARLSATRQEFALEYGTSDLGGGLSLKAELFDQQRDLPAFVRHGRGGALTLEQRLSPNLHAFVGMRYEQVVTPIQARLASVNVGLVYSTPQTTIGMAYEASDRRLGSDYSFDRMHAWFAHHRPLGPLTLHLGGSATQLMGDVPRSELLFIDGVTDLRGYAPGALAPLGGTTKLSARAELEVPLVQRLGLSVVGFTDVGGILGGTSTAVGQSVGVGIQWRSPIGTLRFDWAVPLDGGKPRFLFGFGGAF